MQRFIKKINKWTLIFLVITLLLFWLKGHIALDPDFGYRLVTGQKILQGTFPKTDPYSYTMPSFPYVEHAWTIAASWALLHPLVSRSGLALISSIVAVLAIWISASRTASKSPGKIYSEVDKPLKVDFSHFGKPAFILAIAAILPFVGVRAQVFSWLIAAVFWYFLFDKQKWARFKFATPLFFLFWANIHGSWAAGIVIFFLTIMVRSLSQKRVLFTDFGIAFVSLAATLINPYGSGAWREVWLSISDSAIRWKIAEWMPAFLFADLAFIAFLVMSAFFVWRYRKSFSTDQLVVYFFILAQALLSRRHVPLWILFALPMTVEGLLFLYEEVVKIKFGKQRFKVLYKFAWIMTVVIFVIRSALAVNSSRRLSENKYYPKSAVEYLSQNTPEGEIFSVYAWGGYLIWQLPGQKTFVDGRMPSWRWENYPENETGNAFADYNSLLQGRLDYKEVFVKYNIDTVLLPQSSDSETLTNLRSKINGILSRLGKVPSDFELHRALENDNWERLYEDDTAVIYKK